MLPLKINRRVLIVASVVGLVLVVGGLGWFLVTTFFSTKPQEVAFGEPADIVMDFYQPWLEASQAAETNPYTLGLAKAPVLGETLRTRLTKSAHTIGDGVDAVLCQSGVPTQVTTRPISEIGDQAQVLVMSRDKTQPEQAVVTLTKLNDGWFISEIRCSPGEFGPEREFSFDREGYLLKSVPPPLNPKYWHLVFEENGQPGHVAPLFFDAASMCTALDGAQTVCDENTFTNPSKAHVQGEMTETGVKVKRVTLLEDK